MILRVSLAVGLFFIYQEINAQSFSISGRVILNEDPAIGAHVSLNKTNTTVCDKKGHFSFSSLKSGSHELVIKYVGDEKYHTKIEITDRSASLTIKLVAKYDELNTSNIEIQENETRPPHY